MLFLMTWADTYLVPHEPAAARAGSSVLHPPCSHEAAALMMLFLIQNPGFCVSLSKGIELEWNELLAGCREFGTEPTHRWVPSRQGSAVAFDVQDRTSGIKDAEKEQPGMGIRVLLTKGLEAQHWFGLTHICTQKRV